MEEKDGNGDEKIRNEAWGQGVEMKTTWIMTTPLVF